MKIDDAIFDFQCAANRMETDRSRMFATWSMYAVEWYVKTGRSDYSWEKAFCACNKKTLASFCAKAGEKNGSDDALLAAVTRYLKRYYKSYFVTGD